jgi:osomolarity two-component system, response regulator SKN7
MDSSSLQDSIVWGQNQDSLVVKDPTAFATAVLPLHFKHNKFASFVRQLNKHNFHRVKMAPGHDYGELVGN